MEETLDALRITSKGCGKAATNIRSINMKTQHLFASSILVAMATLNLTSIANAQLLGGSGAANGALNGTLSGGHDMLGGSANGNLGGNTAVDGSRAMDKAGALGSQAKSKTHALFNF